LDENTEVLLQQFPEKKTFGIETKGLIIIEKTTITS